MLADGSSTSMTNLDSINSDDFTYGKPCAYEVKWSEGVNESDELVLTAEDLSDNVQVYVAFGG